jgi:CheY-like chemotaxis protein
MCRRNLAIRFLQLIGCEVDQVTDAESAIAKINSAPFDVVFMDIVLPKMTG